MPYPRSEFAFWVNEDMPTIYNNLKLSTGLQSCYGIYTVRRINSVWLFRFEPYNSLDRYERKYTLTSNVGWVNGGAWKKN